MDKISNRKELIPSTWEGCIVRLSDKIAYLGRDIEDAIIAKWIPPKINIPFKINQDNVHSIIVEGLILDIINNSSKKEGIGFSKVKFSQIGILYDFNMDNIYNNPRFNDYKSKIERGMEDLYKYFKDLLPSLPDEKLDKTFSNLIINFQNYLIKMNITRAIILEEGAGRVVSDYLSGMTDNYFLQALKDYYIPEPLFRV